MEPSTVFGETIVDKGTSGGGQIEVYETVENAKKRDAYLSSFSGFLNPGSHTVLGSMVIRTSSNLTASQQNELERIIVNQFVSTSSISAEDTIRAATTPVPSSYYRDLYGKDQETVTAKAVSKGSGSIKAYDQPSLSGKVVGRIPSTVEVDLTIDPVFAEGTNWVMGKVNKRISGWIPVESLIFPEPEIQNEPIIDAKNDAYKILYDQATSMMQAGNYEPAKLIFETISDYSDVADMIKECDYQAALALEKNGSYVDAMVAFTLLGDYKDSSDHLLQNALKLQQQPQNNSNQIQIEPVPTETPTPKPTAVPAKTGNSNSEILEVKESGFSVSSIGYLFYSFVIRNNSSDIAVRRPSFRVVARDKSGILLGMEDGTLNAFLYPGQDICYGGQGFKVSETPASVEVQIVQPSSFDYKKVSDIDHPEYIPIEFHNTVHTSSRDYLGDAFNPNAYDFSKIEICVLFRDNDNNLKAGQCSTANSLAAESSIPFKISTWCPTETNYEICGFGRLY